MDSDFRPTTPAADLAAWASQRQAAAPGLLTPDLVALAQSGVFVVLAARDRRDWPQVGLGVGCRVLADGRLRLLLSRAANAEVIEAVAGGSPLSVSFTATRNHRSFQVKAASGAVMPAVSDDLPEIDRQTGILRDELVTLGLPTVVAHGFVAYAAEDLAAIEIVPARLFTQTPGPGAGAELR